MATIIIAGEFEEKVLKAEGKVLVDFYADWCGPCQAMAPVLDEIAKEHTVYKISVDDAEEVAMKYGVDGIPCMIVFENGKEVRRSVGMQPKAKIEGMLE